MIRSSLKRGIKKVLGIPNRPETVQPNVEPVRAAAPTPASAPVEDEALDEVVEAVGFADTIENPVEAAPIEEAVIAEPSAEPSAASSAEPSAVAVDGAIDIEEVQEILDDMVRPALQSDGGDITLLKIENNDIYVKLVGSCSSCPSSIMTMKMGVEALLKEEFPSMRELIQIDAMVMPA